MWPWLAEHSRAHPSPQHPAEKPRSPSPVGTSVGAEPLGQCGHFCVSTAMVETWHQCQIVQPWAVAGGDLGAWAVRGRVCGTQEGSTWARARPHHSCSQALGILLGLTCGRRGGRPILTGYISMPALVPTGAVGREPKLGGSRWGCVPGAASSHPLLVPSGSAQHPHPSGCLGQGSGHEQGRHPQQP